MSRECIGGDLDKYGDKFDDDAENPKAEVDEAEEKKQQKGDDLTMYPNSGISVEINLGVKNGASEDSYIPIKSGTTCPMMRNPPYHIKDAEDFEPLYVPQENILEDCLRREAERVAHQENLMNRVVYDCIDPSPYVTSTEPKEGELAMFYQPQSDDDFTL